MKVILPLLPSLALSKPLDGLLDILERKINPSKDDGRWDVPMNFPSTFSSRLKPTKQIDSLPVKPVAIENFDPYSATRQSGGFAAGKNNWGTVSDFPWLNEALKRNQYQDEDQSQDQDNGKFLSPIQNHLQDLEEDLENPPDTNDPAPEIHQDIHEPAPEIHLDILDDKDSLSDHPSYNSNAIFDLENQTQDLADQLTLPAPIDMRDYLSHNFQPNHFTGNLNSLAALTNKFIDQYDLAQNSGKDHLQKVLAMNCYGCWCNRLQDYKKSKGLPVDDFDKICKSHTQAYECMEIDADADRNGEICNPDSVQKEGYKFSFNIVHNAETDGSYDMRVSCDTNSQDWCSQRTCEADIQYLSEFLELSLAGKFIDFDRFGQSGHGGTFDVDSGCGTEKAVHHLPVKQCCGKYPKRRVFRTDMVDRGYRQCCDLEGGENEGQTLGKVFYPDRQVCCGAHGVQEGGECTYYE